jgi:hypothetical protein
MRFTPRQLQGAHCQEDQLVTSCSTLANTSVEKAPSPSLNLSHTDSAIMIHCCYIQLLQGTTEGGTPMLSKAAIVS